ncbi:MAG: hypothetical protein LUF87_08330 [Alistipes sp.]|nr:hypothetical protein [Alistipes sp.]
MKKNKLGKRYCKISTLDELELERDRLAYRIGLKEVDMEHQWEDIKESLTFSNICRTVWNRIEGPRLALTHGFNVFSALFRKKRKKHSCSL